MNVQDIAKRVKRIKTQMKDPENAHVLQDILWYDVLAAIANGTCEDPQECAKLASSVKNLEFPRWFA